jgi:hypothetical protein
MKLIKILTCCLALVLFSEKHLNAQLYKIDLTHKINKAALIVEGKVIEQHSFWNDAHTVIYTSNKLHIYKVFKGKIISKEIEVMTQGGTVGTECLRVSDLVQLRTGMAGMFFLNENGLNIHSPFTGKILYDVYGSDQGFLRYDRLAKVAWAPFAKYQNIQNDLYGALKQSAGVQEQVIDSSFKLNSGTVSNGMSGSAIVSFSPATVHAGALNDPANNILTINGSGFGSSPSNAAGVAFKDANDDSQDPNFKISYTSPYIISWSDTKITLNVPDSAATGKLAVVLNNGTIITAATDLQVFFAVQDGEFIFQNKIVVLEPRLMNANGSGGYTVQYSTSTAGGGKDFSASTARPTFERALATWKELMGANIVVGPTTTVQTVADDGVNAVMYDNINTTVLRMADGVLEATYSWYQVCTQDSTRIFSAQKTGFDVLVRNDAVSTGSIIDFEDGPCFPVQGTYDLETIFLHELGHALNLGHINDDYQNNSNSYTTVNPAKLMHYSVLDYVDRRSPDAAAYQGALYATKQQHNNYGNCGLSTSEMTLLSSTPAANDECPSTFPATEIQNNTIANFDLIHATSNKFGDPSFEQVTCNGKGTSVTNNAYYAFLNGVQTALTIDIKDYTTLPAALASCSGQSLRLALYDVQSCPVGQSYPTPTYCSSFSGNGTITIGNLQQNHKYLLYFDGVRNTKASFTAVFNSDSTQSSEAIVNVFPNPVVNTNLTIQIINPSGAFYEYALFDAIGKLVSTGKISTPQTFQTYLITMNNVAAGVYFLRLVDDNGNAVLKKKILKQH